MAIQKKGIKKNVLMKFNNIQANNWDIDCDANSLNDYSDDYGFYDFCNRYAGGCAVSQPQAA